MLCTHLDKIANKMSNNCFVGIFIKFSNQILTFDLHMEKYLLIALIMCTCVHSQSCEIGSPECQTALKAQQKVPTIYFVRHGRSMYNKLQAQLIQKFKQLFEQSDDYYKMKFDLQYEDCDFIEEGYPQCDQARQKLKDIDLDLIIVSPMRRALATCHRVFKGHKSNAPVIVDPIFRQIIESSCDIGSRLRESMRDYPDFDYSLIKNIDSWYIETLRNQVDKIKLAEKLLHIEQADLNKAAKQQMNEFIKELWEQRKVDPNLFLTQLSPVELQKSKLKILLEKYKSIAIVTHSMNIKSYVGVKPPNCGVMLYKPQYFDLPIQHVPRNFL